MKLLSSKIRIAACLLVLLLILGAGVLTQVGVQRDALAGAEVIGNPDGATSRVLMAPAANGQVKRVIYFVDPVDGQGASLVTPVVTSTPLNSAPICGLGDASIYRADLYLTGTMTGTNPTLAMLWQNSIDGGVTWTSVGTWTTINATVTPASQSQVVADLVASTAVAFGDCWRAQLQFGGTGAVGANIEVVGIAK